MVLPLSPLAGLINLEYLKLGNNPISDLLPLAGLTKLQTLHLLRTSISDLSPLAGLTKLETLYLSNNSISDLLPLVANTGLGIRDTIFLFGNPLSDTSINTHIPTLRSRGITVHRATLFLPTINPVSSKVDLNFLPAKTALLTNYPNPFNPETWIPYNLASDADVTLTIYDIKGAMVRRLEFGYQRAGYYVDRSRAGYWNGDNHLGEPAGSGVYFYQLEAGDFSVTRKMLILK